jgi:hypothetical protein
MFFTKYQRLRLSRQALFFCLIGAGIQEVKQGLFAGVVPLRHTGAFRYWRGGGPRV